MATFVTFLNQSVESSDEHPRGEIPALICTSSERLDFYRNPELEKMTPKMAYDVRFLQKFSHNTP
ncbi:hypothetical protein ACFSYH_03420 [Populibacterium corticicola]|uniref:Uncharacterized protein n=1 Tax=Populibacterium corticicola TaxID=1812826 RepID=A0ABW5XAZ7_9MICO